MFSMETELVKITLDEEMCEDGNIVYLDAEMVENGEKWLVEYSPETRQLISLCVAEQTTDGQGENTSKITGRTVYQCQDEDMTKAMQFYIKKMVESLLQFTL